MAPFLMSLCDLQSHSPIARLFTCGYVGVEKILTDMERGTAAVHHFSPAAYARCVKFAVAVGRRTICRRPTVPSAVNQQCCLRLIDDWTPSLFRKTFLFLVDQVVSGTQGRIHGGRGRLFPPPQTAASPKHRDTMQADQKWILSVPECIKSRLF